MIISKQTELTLQTIGEMIKAARIDRKMSQGEMGNKIGVTRYTISAIEAGRSNVAIGTVFEAATAVGLTLMESSDDVLNPIQEISSLVQVLTPHGFTSKIELDDDF